MSAAGEKIGIVGLGRMGTPIAKHLSAAGFDVVGHDADPARHVETSGLGIRWADELAGLAGVDIVVICVGYERQVEGVVEGLSTIVAAGSLLAVMSTVSPVVMRTLQEQSARAGLRLVDSAVCRGALAADAGTLLSFIGGDDEDAQRFAPVAAAYSTDVVHVGAVGLAQVAKAANNLVMWACLVANHEALALAQRYGADTEQLRQALLLTGARNANLENWGRASMTWASDDLAIVGDMADDRGISLPLTGVLREICRTLRPRRFDLTKYGV